MVNTLKNISIFCFMVLVFFAVIETTNMIFDFGMPRFYGILLFPYFLPFSMALVFFGIIGFIGLTYEFFEKVKLKYKLKGESNA